jgi:acyl transferase domain-containing protein/NADPH:quinone reductase-like Zn-dependent oxidoreductase/acyl carrier protein
MTRAPIAIIGRSCRLPEANNIEAFWRLLVERRCAVHSIDSARWAVRRFFHERKGEPGKSYTFAAGLLDDVWGFDPTVFSISPREAEQMDPQQRLTLQLVWEALEDAGIPPSSLAKTETGVFVGASALDYGNRGIYDPAGIDAYFATGNTLSIISNRVSYAFDLRGPSFTVDTACSSSLVALHEAVLAIESGRIDTAVVVGVNILASPVAFVSFAQASMLSPSGLCRAFDAGADGYVRSEGGVVLILRSARAANEANNRILAHILGCGVNSDGRTVGMSFPSSEGQIGLLSRVYREAGVEPDGLAFIEAHGTGTRVGDPVEALAVGRALAKRRMAPLPIGSVKTNVGHLEPASGLVGVLKAMLALEHHLLPASLHVETLNPEIPFNELNLSVATEPVALAAGAQAAGINSFGFGGTNAHVIIGGVEPEIGGDEPEVDASPGPGVCAVAAPVLALSAQSREALLALAGTYGELLATKDVATVGRVAASVAASRDLMSHRLVVEARDLTTWAARLRQASSAGTSEEVVVDTAIGRDVSIAFMYSGNGSQWVGMGRAFHAVNDAYRRQFADVDAEFTALAGWSLLDALFAENLEQRLQRAEVCQPLLLATQVATAAALMSCGLAPRLVFGHSVGEVAAAHTAGALTLRQAVEVIYSRSRHQELAWKKGTMAAAMLPLEDAEQLIVDGGFTGVEIAAVNSGRSLTLSGPGAQIQALAKLARTRRVAIRMLKLDYPFHTALIECARAPLMADLAPLCPRETQIPFISTVTGGVLAGSELGASYWWDNVRRRVRFAEALGSAIRLGVRLFLEIGPRPVLQAYANEGLASADVLGAVLGCNDYGVPRERDPARSTLVRIIGKGGAVGSSAVFGTLTGRPERLPNYPWQNRRFQVSPTLEMHDVFGLRDLHPLIGTRSRLDSAEWLVNLDARTIPYLRDHRVGGRTIMPAAALVEMALAAGRDWLGVPVVELLDFEIVTALRLDSDSMVEVTTRISPESRTVEILSRPRLNEEPRTLHAVGRISPIPTRISPRPPEHVAATSSTDPKCLYDVARSHGLEYGPAFQGAARVEDLVDGRVLVTLRRYDEGMLAAGGYGLYPPALDSCFHGLIHLFGQQEEARSSVAYLPVRFGEIRLYKPGIPICSALLKVSRVTRRSMQAAFTLLDERGEVVATLDDCRYRAITLERRAAIDELVYHAGSELIAPPLDSPAPTTLTASSLCLVAEQAGLGNEQTSAPGDDYLLLEAFAIALAREAIASVVPRRKSFTTEWLVREGRLASVSEPFCVRLLQMLHALGHVEQRGEDVWRMAPAAKMPPAREILRTVVSDHPARVAEAVLAARASDLLARILREGPPADPPYSASMLLQFAVAGPAARRLADGLTILVRQIVAGWPVDHPLRVLELGTGPRALTQFLAERASNGKIALTVTDSTPAAAERLRFTWGSRPGVRTACLDLGAADTPELGFFDLVVSASPLGRQLVGRSRMRRLSRLLSKSGAVVFGVLEPSRFVDTVFGLEPLWFDEWRQPHVPQGVLRRAAEWMGDLLDGGFSQAQTTAVPTDGDPSRFVFASGRRSAVSADAGNTPSNDVALVAGAAVAPGRLSVLTRAFEVAGRQLHIFTGSPEATGNGRRDEVGWGQAPSGLTEFAQRASSGHIDVVHLVGIPQGSGPVSETVTAGIGETLGLVRAFTKAPARLWIVLPGSLQGVVGGGRDCPRHAAVAAFLRVLVNETPNLDLRIVDLDSELDDGRAAGELIRAIANPTSDREIVVTAQGVCVPRLRRGLPFLESSQSIKHPVVERLAIGQASGIDGLRWSHHASTGPGERDVTVDIQAAGLNFRDVMWAAGLLPDEALEDGYAGPTLGIEGAGTVAEVGIAVHRVKPGDRVIAFASGALASRVVVRDAAVARLPKHLSFEEGATVPVAFLTAYYALHRLARLRRGESLLVHGGAGGVGLAALQIARWLGARTVATAGSEEKRDFLRMIGADHVLSSRNLDFVDEMRSLTDGRGVDVVLNSLAGDAMERSLRTLAPFGRFLELGKRDYYANTRIGLRPFRRNVSYFGIDADQLLAHRQQLAEGLLRDVVRLFEKGVLRPLPYRVFAPEEVRDAFRLMQQSLHVGKIVITPPPVRHAITTRQQSSFAVAARGTHVIVGGLGGFGLATAAWLVERGARHLVLIGRSGTSSDGAKTAVASLEKLGAEVRVVACDAADSGALANALAGVRREMPPIKGVVHAAMVLDDGPIESLVRSRVAAVLRPKIDGAANLDRLTRTDDLAYFILFSSASTVVGNPAQANYVAANAYLESLARARRADGLCGLAVAWGAIEDVGYLARSAGVRDKISRRFGKSGLTAREALDTLGRILSETDGGSRSAAVLTVASIEWSAIGRDLPVLASPVYRQVIAEADVSASDGAGRQIDLVDLVRGRDPQAARDAVSGVLAGEVARILKVPASEIGSQRPLAELGMDSLMSLELRLGIERRFAVEIPLPAISETTTLASIAKAIVSRIQDPGPQALDDQDVQRETEAELVRRHVAEDVSMDELAELSEVVRSKRAEGERMI